MNKILSEIQNGEFAREFILENQAGAPVMKAKRRLGKQHQIEIVGEKLRSMMPWIKANRLVDHTKNSAAVPRSTDSPYARSRAPSDRS